MDSIAYELKLIDRYKVSVRCPSCACLMETSVKDLGEAIYFTQFHRCLKGGDRVIETTVKLNDSQA